MRPEGWENPHPQGVDSNGDRYDTQVRVAYKAGADAMLEGLKATGISVDADKLLASVTNEDSPHFQDILLIKNAKGYLVFIPEEE